MYPMRKALLLYNPAAGRVPVRPFIQVADRALTRAGWTVEVVESESGEHTTHLAQRAAEDGYAAVFAAGGDGTVGQVAAGLVGSETALGVLPAGTSNVWAREMGLLPLSWTRPWALRETALLLANAPICAVDVGECNGRPFLLWAGMGLDALTVQRIEPRMRLEKYFSVPQYAAVTVWHASTWRGLELRLWADGERVEGHFLLALVNNIRHYMGGLANLSPQAYLDDGLMDLWLFSGDSLTDALRHAFDLWSGRHVNSDQARRVPFRSLQVEAEAPFAIEMDGEPVFVTERAEITVRPRALRVLMPPRALDLLRNAPPLAS
ncbi:MAG: diacylglycerol kinase family lipid kinase [Anaerolineae bacterium]|nr:MAG: diacylglycerol kinase family lipid kinase [Anaerolineae bacterium]